MNFEEFGEKLLIEYILKYADFDDIDLCLKLFGNREAKSIWEKKLQNDRNFIKINLMLAKVFFGMYLEANYFKEIKNTRFGLFYLRG